MGRRIALTVFFIVFLATIGWGEEKTTIAILDLDPRGVDSTCAAYVTESIIGALFDTGIYKVTERTKIHEIFKEWEIDQSGCNSDACIIETGKRLAVQQIGAGSVYKIGDLYSISLRIFNVESGEITATTSANCSKCPIEQFIAQSPREAVNKLVGKPNQTQVSQTQPVTDTTQMRRETRPRIKPQIQSKRGFFGQIRQGVTKPAEINYGFALTGVQFGYSIYPNIRLMLSVDYGSQKYDRWFMGYEIANRIYILPAMVSFEVTMPIKNSIIIPYLGLGLVHVDLWKKERNNELGYEDSHRLAGAGFQMNGGCEILLSSKSNICLEIFYLKCNTEYGRIDPYHPTNPSYPTIITPNEFDVSGLGFHGGFKYHF